jgi:putative endonuclease
MGDPRRTLGRVAEEAAARHLERAGLAVVARNVRLCGGEIDLVCRDAGVLVFVEVKCRRARWGDAPGAAVTWQKQRRLTRLAQRYIRWRRLEGQRCRFDVVAVTLGDDGRVAVRHLPAAFDAAET